MFLSLATLFILWIIIVWLGEQGWIGAYFLLEMMLHLQVGSGYLNFQGTSEIIFFFAENEELMPRNWAAAKNGISGRNLGQRWLKSIRNSYLNVFFWKFIIAYLKFHIYIPKIRTLGVLGKGYEFWQGLWAKLILE